ncbi:hypothetical protein V5O48_000530 [Marasmius crinis-equi]|uniref:C3H1-type domain-containing protein n=1 Tax=Marasmius crinis-equi TaxID=585013 RepID=A0ABR3G104_9AGAR
MAICTFFLKGQCRFGDKCRNEHPAGGQTQGGFGNQSWNRGSTSSNTNTTNTNTNTTTLFTVDSIRNDLTPHNDKPLWPLSSYGAAKYETNLISGLDESFEEMRWKAASAMSGGNINQYTQYEAERINNADKAFADARSSIQQAYDQALKQSNLTSMLNNSVTGPTSSSGGGGSAFGTANAGSTSAFGASSTTSAFGSTSGTSAFGAASGSAFGKTSFGQPQSAFGQPSQPSTSVFGQPSQPASAFGQPSQPTSAFGQSSQPASAFGQTSQPTSAFGQPSQPTSAFGQSTQPTSAFGQPSQPSSMFGQASQPSSSLVKPATAGAFGAYANTGPTAFGAGATPPTNSSGGGFAAFANPSGQASAFGGAAPSAFGSNTPATTPAFGSSASNTSQTPSAFGTQASGGGVFGSSAISGGAFGSATPAASSAFGSAPATTSVFGSTSTPGASSQTTSVFGSSAPVSAFGSNASPAPSAFGSSNTTTAFGSNPSGSFSGGFGNTPAPQKSSSSVPDFKAAMAQSYVPGKCPYDSQLPLNYLEVVPKAVVEVFKAEKFEWGKVPDWIPPLELR